MSYNKIESALGPKSHTVIANLTKMKSDDHLVLRMAYEVDMSLIKHGMNFIKISKNIIPDLSSLKKMCILALRTNSRRPFVSAVMDKSHIKSKFYSKFAGIVTMENKIDKEFAIRKFMKKFHASKKETIYVGDMVNDVQVAKKIGCTSVAIVGWHSAKKLSQEKPDYLIRKLGALRKIVKESN
jgi:phosphoglycolate phosphatase-like HAD superfamily hydrolase